MWAQVLFRENALDEVALIGSYSSYAHEFPESIIRGSTPKLTTVIGSKPGRDARRAPASLPSTMRWSSVISIVVGGISLVLLTKDLQHHLAGQLEEKLDDLFN